MKMAKRESSKSSLAKLNRLLGDLFRTTKDDIAVVEADRVKRPAPKRKSR